MKLLLDENFNNKILRGLLQKHPQVDVLRVQDIPEIAGRGDPEILAWAAEYDRVLLTHDVRTITHFAYERLEQNLPMVGVIEVNRFAPLGTIIEDLLIVLGAGNQQDIENIIMYIPFK